MSQYLDCHSIASLILSAVILTMTSHDNTQVTNTVDFY